MFLHPTLCWAFRAIQQGAPSAAYDFVFEPDVTDEAVLHRLECLQHHMYDVAYSSGMRAGWVSGGDFIAMVVAADTPTVGGPPEITVDTELTPTQMWGPVQPTAPVSPTQFSIW